ncbi:MAG: hypothetical protein ABIA04_11045 [Pseudomonadota bacterium]
MSRLIKLTILILIFISSVLFADEQTRVCGSLDDNLSGNDYLNSATTVCSQVIRKLKVDVGMDFEEIYAIFDYAETQIFLPIFALKQLYRNTGQPNLDLKIHGDGVEDFKKDILIVLEESSLLNIDKNEIEALKEMDDPTALLFRILEHFNSDEESTLKSIISIGYRSAIINTLVTMGYDRKIVTIIYDLFLISKKYKEANS